MGESKAEGAIEAKAGLIDAEGETMADPTAALLQPLTPLGFSWTSRSWWASATMPSTLVLAAIVIVPLRIERALASMPGAARR